MRILLVTGLTHYGRAGVQRETERLIAGLLERGASVALLADTPIPDSPAVRHFTIPFPPSPDVEQRIADALAAHGAQVMHVIGGGVRLLRAAGRAADRAARATRQGQPLPWVITVHNVPPRESTVPWLQGHNALHYPLRNALRFANGRLWRRFLRRAGFARVVCHSPDVSAVVRDAGCPARRIARIPLGCDGPDGASTGEPERATPSGFADGEAPRIVSVGGMAHHKGFHDYLRALTRLVADYPNLRYVIMGDVRDPHYRRTLERLIHRLGLSGHVRLVARAPEAQRLVTARAADLYVVPSHEEGFCLSYLEGAMLSPRVLGTRCGVIAEIADGDRAQRVVPPGDPHALEHATRELLHIDVSSSVLAHRRADLLRRYDWGRYVEAHLELYEHVLRRRMTDTSPA